MEQGMFMRRGLSSCVVAVSAVISTGSIAVAALATPAWAAEQTLYSFVAPAGAAPSALVMVSSGSLFGVTSEGGASGGGTLFQLVSPGVVKALHSFSGGDGAGPDTLIDGGNGYLYGATLQRMVQQVTVTTPPILATIFRSTRDGQVTSLYTYAAGTAEFGARSLVMNGGDLYGTTWYDGASGLGTLFKLGANGTYTVLHSFTDSGDGAYPEHLISGSDGNFYGVTASSSGGGGTLFRLAADGSFSTLHSFPPPPPFTYARLNALVQGQDGALYGAIAGMIGSVFRFSPADGNYTDLHDFTPTPPMLEAGPETLLQAANGLIYGSSSGDGASGQGSLFQLDALGDYQLLHSFTGTGDGGAPNALVAAPSGNTLLGATPANIGAAGQGSLFSLQLANSGFSTLYRFRYPHGERPNDLLLGSDGLYYGTTAGGGGSGNGTLFRIGPRGQLQTLYSFTGGMDGAAPVSLTQARDGSFYGRASSGGAYGNGTIFRFTPQQGLAPIYAFTGEGNGSGTPLVEGADGNFYGTGLSGNGQIFRVTPSGVLTNLFFFTGTLFDAPDGIYPSALIFGSNGNLYGTTRGLLGPGVAGPPGTVFTLNTSNAFRTVFDFVHDPDSFAPVSLMQASDGLFYGTTDPELFEFSPDLAGSVFRVDNNGNFATVYSFSGGQNGVGPQNLIEGHDGSFYGYTAGFDPSPDQGSVFQLTADGSLTTLYSFHATDVNEYGYVVQPTALVESADGRLFGTTIHGGAAGSGSVFVVDEPATAGAKRR